MRKFFWGVVDTLQLISVTKFQKGQLGSAGQFLDILMGQILSPMVNTKANYCQKFISNIQSCLVIHALLFFPLLTKILDANASLSIQVHPDDAYAEEHEHELGKTECWYVIHAEPGAYLTYGHTAKTRDELIKMINNHQWSKLFSKKPVKTGDFVYVPSGTIHALNKGIIVLETQQSSDTTYRIYDYDRRDKKQVSLKILTCTLKVGTCMFLL